MKINNFDFEDCAELYICHSRRGGQKSMTYKRFDNSADAILFSVEKLSRASYVGTILEVNGKRYHHHQIRQLYDSNCFPLERRL